MSQRRDIYVVHYTAVVHGRAYYSIPEGEKLKHFVDGSSEIEWDMHTIERVEAHDNEWVDSVGDDDPTVEVDPNADIPF
jgi:hypothetical protein